MEKTYCKIRYQGSRQKPLRDVDESDDLARNCTTDSGQLICRKGTDLTERTRSKLRQFGVRTVSVLAEQTKWVEEDAVDDHTDATVLDKQTFETEEPSDDENSESESEQVDSESAKLDRESLLAQLFEILSAQPALDTLRGALGALRQDSEAFQTLQKRANALSDDLGRLRDQGMDEAAEALEHGTLPDDPDNDRPPLMELLFATIAERYQKLRGDTMNQLNEQAENLTITDTLDIADRSLTDALKKAGQPGEVDGEAGLEPQAVSAEFFDDNPSLKAFHQLLRHADDEEWKRAVERFEKDETGMELFEFMVDTLSEQQPQLPASLAEDVAERFEPGDPGQQRLGVFYSALHRAVETGEYPHGQIRQVQDTFQKHLEQRSFIQLFEQDTSALRPLLHAHNTALVLMAILPQSSDRTNHELIASAIFMDVGVALVPDAFLKPEHTTRRALVERSKHPLYSHEIMSRVRNTPETVRTVVKQHHEQWDGDGYPQGLSADELAPEQAFVHAADYYATELESHPDNPADRPDHALETLRELSLPEAVLEHFEDNIGANPPGSIVELADGRVALIKGRVSAEKADALVLTDTDHSRFSSPRSGTVETTGARTLKYVPDVL